MRMRFGKLRNNLKEKNFFFKKNSRTMLVLKEEEFSRQNKEFSELKKYKETLEGVHKKTNEEVKKNSIINEQPLMTSNWFSQLTLLKKKEELAEKNSKVDVIILDSAGAVAASNLLILKGMCGRESMEIKEMVQFINTPKEARFDKSDPVDKESPDVYGLLLLGSSKEDKNIQEHDGVGAGMPLCLYTSVSCDPQNNIFFSAVHIQTIRNGGGPKNI
eukprot:GHVL01029933.1.p1 GENE.GHVL01029933.1~~GHVL01029933.1.p1  ORF type:complete len:217 (+),score=37.80 GHVL01029933.1:949-1599(+)